MPLVRLKPAMPSLLLLGPPSRETVPAGVPLPVFGATVTLKFTDCPCVMVVGVRLFNVVVEARDTTELHLVTRFWTFTDPRPVAKS